MIDAFLALRWSYYWYGLVIWFSWVL